jgi:hypothetical protein
MNEKLTKELETQTQKFTPLITDYCRFESVAAQNHIIPKTTN